MSPETKTEVRQIVHDIRNLVNPISNAYSLMVEMPEEREGAMKMMKRYIDKLNVMLADLEKKE